MNRKLRALFLLSVIGLSASVGGATFAQDREGGTSGGATANRTTKDDDGFDLGWIGLAGLLGLLGLLKRDKHDRNGTHSTTNR